MKTFTYAAAIALLTASAAFAQSSNTSPNNGSMMNNSTPTPTMSGPAESGDTSQSATKGSMAAQPSTNDSGVSGMSGKSTMSDSGKAMKHQASANAHVKARHIASSKAMKSDRGSDGQANQETSRLNQSQLSGNGMMANGMNRNGTSMNGNGNAFDNGRPQAAQAGGSDCSPDNPSCGTARQNPAINSSPQHRLQAASPGAAGNE